MSGDRPSVTAYESIKINLPGMPHLSKMISSSVAVFESGATTFKSNLEVDLANFEERSRRYFYQKSVMNASMSEDSDVNDNSSAVASVTLPDPLIFWVIEVNLS